MACKRCASERQQFLSAELSLASLRIEELKQAPLYVIQKIPVCLDCGYLELTLPTTELEKLRKGM
jgi:hypothetical protein